MSNDENKEINQNLNNRKEEEKNLNIFMKALTVFVRFIKWTVVDVITKAVLLGLTAAKAVFQWVVSLGRK